MSCFSLKQSFAVPSDQKKSPEKSSFDKEQSHSYIHEQQQRTITKTTTLFDKQVRLATNKADFDLLQLIPS